MSISYIGPAAESSVPFGFYSGNSSIEHSPIRSGDKVNDALLSTVRTKSTQRALEPLVCQINQLLQHQANSLKSFHRVCTSLSPGVLLSQLDMAMHQFVDVGNKVADELKSKGDHCGCQVMLEAVQVLNERGSGLREACSSLLGEPTANDQRSQTAQQAHGVLVAVANLLGVCDQVDVARLQRASVELKLLLEELGKDALSPSAMDTFQRAVSAHGQLIALATHHQEDLCAVEDQERIAEEIRWLKQLPPILSSSLKASLAHSVSAAAAAGRQASCRLVCKAVDHLIRHCIEDLLSDTDGQPSLPVVLTPGQPTSPQGLSSQGGKLCAALTAFELQITKEPPSSQTEDCTAHLASIRHRWNGISRLCDDIFDINIMASERHDTAFRLLQDLEKKLGQLLTTITNLPAPPPGGQRDIDSLSSFDDAVHSLLTLTNQLRRQLHRGVADCLLDAVGPKATSPGDALLHCALHQPQEDDIVDHGRRLVDHCSAIVTVSGLVLLLAEDRDIQRRIKAGRLHVELLTPQLAESAHLMCQFPSSTCAQQALGALHQLWCSEVRQLVDSLESGVRLRDLLAVIDHRLREDLAACATFVHHRSEEALEATSQHVQANMQRAVSLTECYVSALHSQKGRERQQSATASSAEGSSPRKRSADKLCEALEKLKDDGIPGFSTAVTKVLGNVRQRASSAEDHEELLRMSSKVVTAVKRVRQEFCTLEMRWSDIGDDSDDEEEDSADSIPGANGSNNKAHLPEVENGRRNVVTLSTIIEETEEEFSDDEVPYKRRSRSQSRRSSHVFAMPEGKSLGHAQRLVATFEKWSADHKKELMPMVFEIVGNLEKVTVILRQGVAVLREEDAAGIVLSAVGLWEDTSEQCQLLLQQCQDNNLYRSLVAGLARVSLLWHQLSLAVQVNEDEMDCEPTELLYLTDDLFAGVIECMEVCGDISAKALAQTSRRQASKESSLLQHSSSLTRRSLKNAGDSLGHLGEGSSTGESEPLHV